MPDVENAYLDVELGRSMPAHDAIYTKNFLCPRSHEPVWRTPACAEIGGLGQGNRASGAHRKQKTLPFCRLSRPQRGQAGPSGAGGEGVGVLNRLERGALRVVVVFDRSVLRVGDGHAQLHVGQAAGEDPIPRGAGVDAGMSKITTGAVRSASESGGRRSCSAFQ